MLNVSEIVGLLGLVLFMVGYLNKSKAWSKTIKNLGFALMAIHIIFDACLGGYDGWMGNPHR